MLTFISCAKTMASRCSLDVPEMTVPHFEAEAVRNVLGNVADACCGTGKTLEGERKDCSGKQIAFS